MSLNCRGLTRSCALSLLLFGCEVHSSWESSYSTESGSSSGGESTGGDANGSESHRRARDHRAKQAAKPKEAQPAPSGAPDNNAPSEVRSNVAADSVQKPAAGGGSSNQPGAASGSSASSESANPPAAAVKPTEIAPSSGAASNEAKPEVKEKPVSNGGSSIGSVVGRAVRKRQSHGEKAEGVANEDRAESQREDKAAADMKAAREREKSKKAQSIANESK